MLAESTYEKCDECLSTSPSLFAGHCLTCIREQLNFSADQVMAHEEDLLAVGELVGGVQAVTTDAEQDVASLMKDIKNGVWDDESKADILEGVVDALGAVLSDLDDATRKIPKIDDYLESVWK